MKTKDAFSALAKMPETKPREVDVTGMRGDSGGSSRFIDADKVLSGLVVASIGFAEEGCSGSIEEGGADERAGGSVAAFAGSVWLLLDPHCQGLSHEADDDDGDDDDDEADEEAIVPLIRREDELRRKRKVARPPLPTGRRSKVQFPLAGESGEAASLEEVADWALVAPLSPFGHLFFLPKWND